MKTESGLYDVLEKILKGAKNPMTCVEMYDIPEVREFAQSANRVSDYLGGLWRKGLVVRMPAPRGNNTAARWMYAWKPQSASSRAVFEPKVVEYSKPGKSTLLNRPSIQITEDGKDIVIDLPSLRITIQTK